MDLTLTANGVEVLTRGHALLARPFHACMLCQHLFDEGNEVANFQPRAGVFEIHAHTECVRMQSLP